jgi:hypothetical protein
MMVPEVLEEFTKFRELNSFAAETIEQNPIKGQFELRLFLASFPSFYTCL